LNNIPDRAGVEYIIAQTDGTMIPLPDTEDKGGDKEVSDGRKIRKGTWKEARVTLTHPSGSITPQCLNEFHHPLLHHHPIKMAIYSS
jgi:hypothetical protein